MAALPKEQLQLLKMFVQACEANPAIVHAPELDFYRDYLVSLGAKLPPAPAWEPPKEEAKAEEKEEPKPSSTAAPPPAAEAEDSEEDSPESDVEINLEFVSGPESEPLPELPSTDVEVTEENMDSANDKRSEAMRLMSDGELEAAVAALSEAIKLNPCMAVLYAKRAQLFVRMKRPNAAVQDCDRALELNDNSALAYKQRGRAYRLLGKIDQAYRDLGKGQGIDYDEDTDELQKSMKDDVHKVQEHENRKSHKEKEKELKRRKKEAARRRAEAQKAYEERQREEASRPAGGMPGGFPGGFPGEFPGGFPGAGGMPGGMGGMPGGMPGGMGGMPGAGGAGGMPAGLGELLSDPDLVAALQDPEVSTAFMEITQNPAAADKYKNNPKVMKVIDKLKSKFGGEGPGPAGAASGGAQSSAGGGAFNAPPTGPSNSSNDLD